MPANRSGLTVYDGAERHHFAISPTGKGGRGISIQTRPWEPGDPQQPWRIPLHPWDFGLGPDRLYPGMNSKPRTYAKANADSSYRGLLLFPPKVTAVTLTDVATPPSKAVELYVGVTDGPPVVQDDVVYMVSGRYMYYFRPSTMTFVKAKDFGSGNLAQDAEIFNGDMYVALGSGAKMWKRTASSGPTAAWTQATDALYADRLCRVGTRLYRISDTNKITGCSASAPLTLSNWTTPSYVGDTTYGVNTLIDYGGVLWAGKPDGMYSPDPNGLYVNQTPQLKSYPHPDNCKGAFTAQGYLFVPSAAGLIRIKPGQSKVVGPEIAGRPDYRFWVRGGVEFGDAIYLLCTDEGATQQTFICKMVYDDSGQSGREYIFYEWCRLGANAADTTKGYMIAVTGKSTNPTLIAGFGNNVKYISLGRGGGRDVDDANYEFGTAMELETGDILPGQDLGVISVLQGVTTVLRYAREGESLTVSYRSDGEPDSKYREMLSSQEGGGIAKMTLTDSFEAVTRYAPPDATGQFFEFKFNGICPASTKGTTRPEVREAWAFGYSRPRSTDNVTITVYAGPRTAGINGIANGKSTEETVRLFRHWMDSSTVLKAEVPEYEQGRPTRFLVTAVETSEQAASIGEQHETSAQAVRVTMTRLDFAGEFANAE